MKNYDLHKKDVVDEKGEYKPRHASALILSKLDEVLDLVKKCNEDNKDLGNRINIVNSNILSLINKKK